MWHVDKVEVPTYAFEPIFHGSDTLHLPPITDGNVRRAKIFMYPSPLNDCPDLQENYSTTMIEEIEEWYKEQDDEFVLKIQNVYDEESGEIFQGWKKWIKREGEIMKELNDLGDMNVPKFREMIDLEEEYGVYGLVMDRLGYDIYYYVIEEYRKNWWDTSFSFYKPINVF